jgi:hypothetical protein
MKIIYLLLTSILITGCSSSKALKLKSDNNRDKIEVVAKMAYVQEAALAHTNLSKSTELNSDIQEVVGPPPKSFIRNITPLIKPLNNSGNTVSAVSNFNNHSFQSDIVKIKKDEYIADRSVEDELFKIREELHDYKEWFGLKGVWLSLKQVGRNLFFTAAGMTVLFFILRIFAHANPIILAVWNFISSMLAWAINKMCRWIPTLADKIIHPDKK